MSNRLKGKALPQTDPYRKPKKNPGETRGGVYGEGIIRACIIGLAFWFVAWLAFC
jgi:hypothetical protein